MNGEVAVFAFSQEEAISKVEEQIKNGKVDNDLTMHDGASGVVMAYEDVVNGGNDVEIDESQIEVDEEDSSRG